MLDNITSALASIWGNKLRSLLTLLGVVIGVFSVTILVAVGQGVKKEVSGLIQGFGTNVVTVVPGQLAAGAGGSGAGAGNPADAFRMDILTPKDVETVKAVPDVLTVTPLTLVGGGLKVGEKSARTPVIYGANADVLQTFQVLALDKGRMFTDADTGKVMVLSTNTAKELFGDVDPLGKTVALTEDEGVEEFTVIGTVKASSTSGLFGSEISSVSIVPFDQATRLNKNQVGIYRIISKASDTADVKKIKATIHDEILKNHKGKENFSVFTQDDLLGLFDTFLSLATAMVSAIAAISLLVGGIGIMNIMLVTVTERTREIGLRKAIGATRTAILGQFLAEAVIITLVGGLLGLALSAVGALVVRAKTPLHPEFSWQTIALTVGVSLVIGVIFGIWPALRAARKDPIEALRYE